MSDDVTQGVSSRRPAPGIAPNGSGPPATAPSPRTAPLPRAGQAPRLCRAMIRASLLRLERMLDDSAVVLDIGGWGRPLARADWVVDHMPYETRGLYGRDGDGAERF